MTETNSASHISIKVIDYVKTKKTLKNKHSISNLKMPSVTADMQSRQRRNHSPI